MEQNLDRSKANWMNSNIYKYFKEEDFLQLTDEEFAVLQTKTRNYYQQGAVWHFGEFFQGLDGNAITGDGDSTDFKIYKRISQATNLDRVSCFYRYERVFTMCRALGVTNVFDLGCGQHLQSSLLVYDPDMFYTGIDRNIFQDFVDDFMADPDYVNGLFERFTSSDRIKYIKGSYPCELTVPEHNLAIAFCSLPIGKAEVTDAISKDFERIVINRPIKEYNLTGISAKDVVYTDEKVWRYPFDEYYGNLKKAMPDFEFYILSRSELGNYVFGTKVPGDKEKLAKRYHVVDDMIMTDFIDTDWDREMLR